jgi:hypothetical protein
MPGQNSSSSSRKKNINNYEIGSSQFFELHENFLLSPSNENSNNKNKSPGKKTGNKKTSSSKNKK